MEYVLTAFHDCITKCDGCVDLSNSHNAGLEPIVTALDRLKTQVSYMHCEAIH